MDIPQANCSTGRIQVELRRQKTTLLKHTQFIQDYRVNRSIQGLLLNLFQCPCFT
jgi:hypothetical protein